MSDIRISNTTGDLQRVNQKLEQALQAARRLTTTVSVAKQGILGTNTLGKTSNTTTAIASTNLNLSWQGGTLTVAWPKAYVQALDGTNFPIPSGSKVLVASTTYTVFWNSPHQQLVFSDGSNLVALSANTHNINLFTFFTGAGGDSGWAGGPGGTTQSFGTLGQNYKNF